MSATIEIDKDLFLKMIFSLLDESSTKQQVDWLQSYGSNFYELGLYEAVEQKHAIEITDFEDVVNKFWDGDVLYKEVSWGTLSEFLGTNFYQKYIAFGFDAKKTITDIDYRLENFDETSSKRYYSPSLLKCIAANHDFASTDTFYFTKAMMPNYEVGIVFKIMKDDQIFCYDICQNPV